MAEKIENGSERESGEEQGSSGRRSSRSSSGSGDKLFQYHGWVYHLGTNSIGHEFCHLRFLLLKGKYAFMYKRDPFENTGHKPIRKGVIGPSLMVEELGRKGAMYVLKFYNRLDETKKGEIALTTAGDARAWMEAFEQAKQQADFDLTRGSSRQRLSIESELNLEGHRPRVRRYAHGLTKLIKIGKGPEVLLRQSSNLESNTQSTQYSEGDVDDAIEAHEWKCIHTTNGIRIFEEISSSKSGRNILLKAVGVVDASLDTVFEVVYNLDKHTRYEWDTVSDHLELVDSIDGHFDVVYGTYTQKYQAGVDCCGWAKMHDFVFSRQWFRGQDGAYTILQRPAVHKKCPRKSGYQRTKVNPSIWEIKMLKPSAEPNHTRCLVTQMIEVHPSGRRSGNRHYISKLERTIEFALLCQVAGLREYFNTKPASTFVSDSKILQKEVPKELDFSGELSTTDASEQFYDAIAANESLEEEDSDDEEVELNKEGKLKLKNVSWAIAAFSMKKKAAPMDSNELDLLAAPVNIAANQFRGSMQPGKDQSDSDCWMETNGNGFMIRGKTYLSDFSKISGGDPLLKLFAVDWLKDENRIDEIALHPNCVVQSEAVRRLPFVLVLNLQVPAKPNYSLVLYYGSERPIRQGSLLSKFVDGTDAFRNSRFKLIPSIVEGYWMVKRAVGTKACLLGRAVTCKYLRRQNFLEIDVDIGSSSVARGIISLVLGYVTSLVIDLAVLIEAKEENELPEHILGTVRLNKIKVESAVSF
ncbi:protein ENHANCED DISEASE RESISTANCE 2 [Nymphaea colorata]|nr:protein ENHANCED DISEASE RESISTANCE 2 [Nymphaea colorata]